MATDISLPRDLAAALESTRATLRAARQLLLLIDETAQAEGPIVEDLAAMGTSALETLLHSLETSAEQLTESIAGECAAVSTDPAHVGRERFVSFHCAAHNIASRLYQGVWRNLDPQGPDDVLRLDFIKDQWAQRASCVGRLGKVFPSQDELDIDVLLVKEAIGAAQRRGEAPTDQPKWDKGKKTLSFNGVAVKEFRQVAEGQYLVLDSFEEMGWPMSIDDPLTGDCPDRVARLNNTVKSLNRQQNGTIQIRFSTNGRGTGFSWSAKKNDRAPRRAPTRAPTRPL